MTHTKGKMTTKQIQMKHEYPTKVTRTRAKLIALSQLATLEIIPIEKNNKHTETKHS